VLAVTGVVPLQIEISATYMLVEKAVADELSMRGALDVANIQQAWRDGKATIVANPQIVTQSGQEATMKMVDEIIYPTEFDYEASNVSADDPSVSSNDVAYTAEASDVTKASAIFPAAFETREVGVIFSVLPEMTPEGTMIYLAMSPAYVILAGWKDYEAVVFDGNGQSVRVACPQPLFRSSQTTTSLLLKSGATMLAAVDVWHPDTESYLALLVRATLIGIDGKPLHVSP
jgi:type II secretory pathway component GspD/PulD (secretin)